ncbi:Uncharacterised protein [Bacteroides xylanisolvens]|nr:Uncharacterised protein [Bacteroides xylanisolvens]
MTEIQIGFRAVIGDEDLAVLVRAHGARVDIDVRIEFLNGDFVASVLQQSAQGCSGDAFAQG